MSTSRWSAGLSREGDRTILEFVGSNAQIIEVNETPEKILAIHLGGSGERRS
ncbi:hypothetical protein [Bradyrhizobium sp. USDA 3364]